MNKQTWSEEELAQVFATMYDRFGGDAEQLAIVCTTISRIVAFAKHKHKDPRSGAEIATALGMPERMAQFVDLVNLIFMEQYSEEFKDKNEDRSN